MIPAEKHPWVEAWFRRYTRAYLRRSFHRVLLSGELPPPPEQPRLVCMSHSSWWDLLLGFWLCRDVLGWDGYAPMDARQLRRYPMLRRIGVFGVERESLRGGREFVEYGRGLLAGSRRSLWITAQGEMTSTSRRPVRFYSGAGHLAEALAASGDGVEIVTLALEYELWDEKRPEAFVRFGPVRRVAPGSSGFRRELTRELEEDLTRELDHLFCERTERDPARFTELLRGEGGISPVYDFLRRVSALARGGAGPGAHGEVPTPPRWGPASRRRREGP
ncbi:MAG: lysophospholipid acyltransferase family protein [Armatimonadota bacterium]